jgi:Na+-transporting NADH:ubiquinone oxidoreductase subunit F
MLQVLGSIIVFPAVIGLLTVVLLAAEARLRPQRKIKITINGDEAGAIETDAGGTLLNTLSSNGVMLPSACGGGGTCGVCKCQVTAGGGDILPTEQSHINYRESKEDWRLSCQVKVREDMEITVPDEVFSINKWECEVIGNKSVATYIREFTLKLPEGENLNFESGGYIQIEVPPFEADFKDFGIEEEYLEEWTKLGVLDLRTKGVEPVARAYSMANHPAEGNIVMLNIRIATPPVDREKRAFMDVMPGLASSYVYSQKVGDRVTISGPYGEFFMQETDREMCYIGGGAGMAPLRSHIFHLFHTLKTGRKVSYWYGARSKREIFYEDHFRKIEKEFPNFTFHIALSEPLPEDNWDGPVGFIHQVVQEHYLDSHEAPEDIEYYLCGPPLMLTAVRKMLDDLGVEPEMIRFDEF